ncbi:MAG: anthranilate phosphoribosyltransferase [Chloroflexi bacterium]|nr:anthranilate phosphoribosyltransferase [Chloroflexota bacterium]
MREAIRKLVEGEHLTKGEAASAMEDIMDGSATPAQIAGLLVALRLRGETPDEITGFAEVMRDRAVAVPCTRTDLVDTCGTGGDRLNTFNISTAAAFVAAGAGVRIAKHGNRAASSRCGSADVLHSLGVNIEMAPEAVSECIDVVGIGFLFAQRFHPSMKHAAGPRSELGVRTVFNILGPLTNPAGACRQIMGVSEGSLTEVLAHVLRNLGSVHAFVVHGSSGIDEISLVGETKVTELKNGVIHTTMMCPEDFRLEPGTIEDIRGGDVSQNREILLRVLQGQKGHQRNVVVVNAAAAIIAGDRAQSFPEAVTLAEESIDTGAALSRLEALCDFSNAAGA